MMRWVDYCGERRRQITECLQKEFADKIAECGSVTDDSTWALTQVREFALGGKMLRGILACLSYEMFAGTSERHTDPIRLAATLELVQAGLLVHDDIMDRDEIRRGKPALHKAFGRRNNSEKIGEAQAICAGDICYFISIKELKEIDPKIGDLFARELTSVCLAQMQDIKSGESAAYPSLDEVLSMYKYKTGRYTIVLPLQAGAIAAGRDDALPYLEAVGENAGILFQIQDDRLGLFGDANQLGKPVGSDIREGKKTPYVLYLLDALSEAEKRVFLSILGKRDLSVSEIEHVRTLTMKYGIDQKVYDLACHYEMKAQNALSKLSKELPSVDAGKLDLLKQFIDSSLSRTK